MHVQLAVLADAANLSQEGKLNITGVFDRINAPVVPVLYPLMVFVARVRISAGDGSEVKLRFRIVDEEGNLVAPEVAIRADVGTQGDGEMANLPLILPIVGAVFKEFGTYSFELWTDGGIRLAEVPLGVRQRASA